MQPLGAGKSIVASAGTAPAATAAPNPSQGLSLSVGTSGVTCASLLAAWNSMTSWNFSPCWCVRCLLIESWRLHWHYAPLMLARPGLNSDDDCACLYSQEIVDKIGAKPELLALVAETLEANAHGDAAQMQERRSSHGQVRMPGLQ